MKTFRTTDIDTLQDMIRWMIEEEMKFTSYEDSSTGEFVINF